MNQLVKELHRPNPVECIRPEKSIDALKACIDRNYVHIFFKETGTELSVQLYRPECKLDESASGSAVRLVGGVTLNYERVKCVADIDLSTCEGVGYLQLVNTEEYARMTS
jgi:hypothetical protein